MFYVEFTNFQINYKFFLTLYHSDYSGRKKAINNDKLY